MNKNAKILNKILSNQSIKQNIKRIIQKGIPLTLLVGMQTSTTTMENSVEIP